MLLFLGDIHGEFISIQNIIIHKKIENCTIIQVGDFGVGFHSIETTKKLLNDLNSFLKSKNINLLAIRGNHDDPLYFNKDWQNIHDFKFSNIELVEDYTVKNINNQNILFIGGAISIDRSQRSSISYWSNEGVNLDEEKLNTLRNIDIVVTHTTPQNAYPLNNTNNDVMSHGPLVEQFAKYDIYLKDDLNESRRKLSKIFEILKSNNKIKFWYYGHFHTHKKELIEDTNFILLDIKEFYEHKNQI